MPGRPDTAADAVRPAAGHTRRNAKIKGFQPCGQQLQGREEALTFETDFEPRSVPAVMCAQGEFPTCLRRR